MDEDQIFIVGRGNVLTRLDPRFQQALRAYSKLVVHDGQPLKKLISAMYSGGTPSTLNPDYWNGAIPWVSPKDFGDFELTSATDSITERALKYSSAKIADKGTIILVVRSGVLLHTIPIAIAGTSLAFNQDVKALVCRSGILPHYLAAYFRIFQDWLLPVITKFGATVQSINTAELKSLEIPVPSLEIQSKVASIYMDALSASKAMHEKASILLASIDDYLLAELGITLPTEPENTLASRIFTTQRLELPGWRFDPQALHPEREACIAELQRLPSHPLRRAASFCRNLCTDIPDSTIYIGLENIESNTGRYIPSSDKESVSSAFAFSKGQVLFPKLRPYLNKVFFAPFDGLCSTEFHVLDGITIRNEFLALFLRSQLVVKQTKHLMSGNTLPRLQTEDIENLLIPEVEDTLQQRIIKEAELRMTEAEHLRQQAETELEAAKLRIEALLLGEAT